MSSGNLDDLTDDELLVWFEALLVSTAQRYPGEPSVISYGEDALQVIDVWGDQRASTWVVSVHGGYFAAEYDRSVNEPLSRRIASEGIAVANVEYRRAGSAADPRDSVSDVRAAIATVMALAPRGARIIVTGHSAGGYLALTGAVHPGITAVVPLAPVTDLVATARGGWDEGAIGHWIGEPLKGDENPPDSWLRMQVEVVGHATAPLTILHGNEDRVVPHHLSRDFVDRHEEVLLVELPNTGHFEFLDPDSTAVGRLLEEIHSQR